MKRAGGAEANTQYYVFFTFQYMQLCKKLLECLRYQLRIANHEKSRFEIWSQFQMFLFHQNIRKLNATYWHCYRYKVEIPTSMTMSAK